MRYGYELAKKEDRLLDWEATIKPKILSDVMEHYLGDKLRAIGVKGMMGGRRHLPDPEQNKLDQEAYRPPMPLVSVGKSAPTNALSSHTVASQNPQNLPGRWTDVNNGERVALHHIKEIQDALNKYPEGSLGEFTSLADIALTRILKKAGSGIATFGQDFVNSFTSDSPIDLEAIEVTPENSTGGKPKEELVGKGKWEPSPHTPYMQERIAVANYKQRQINAAYAKVTAANAVYDGALTFSKGAPVAIAANAKVADAKEGGLVKSLTASDLPPGVMNAKSPKDVTEAGKVELVNFYKAMTDIVWPDNPLMSKVAIAQAIQESGWHVSELARKDNNLVGIKAGKIAPGTKGSVKRSTKEESKDGVSTIEAKFSANNSFLESFKQHRSLLEKHYASALKKTTFLEIAKELKRIGYATDKDYAKALDGIAITRRIKKDK